MISIIVSIYNGENYLDRCLKSLVKQSVNHFEIILVDDGSIDSSYQICKHYASIYKNIKIIQKQNEGLSIARLAGLKVASGDYVIFIDCDDYVASNLVEELYKRIKLNYADLILFDYFVIDKFENKSIHTVNLPESLERKYNPDIYAIESIGDNWNNQNFIQSFLWIRCIKKNILNEQMFVSERICYTEDVLFNLSISYKINTVSYIKKPLYFYCLNNYSLTMKYRENMWKMLKFKQQWIYDFCKENNIIGQAVDRYEKSFWSSIMIAFDNATKVKEYKLAKAQMEEIRNDKEVRRYLVQTIKKIFMLSYNEVIKLILIYFRQYRVYWAFKNRRI